MAEIIIVGGGAAGLMAAGAACRLGHRVTVLEHSEIPGKKILVTGKGRCNVTNNCDEETFLQNVRTNPRFLYSALRSWPPASTMALFEELGVPLKTERGRRVFPVSDQAEDIRQALLTYAQQARIQSAHVTKLLLEEGRCTGVEDDTGRQWRGDCVLIATGGVSYPGTGSRGDGYKLAAQAGHKIIPPVASLCSLVSPDPDCPKMMGLALKNVTLTLYQDQKAVFSQQGEMLFTHFGISGPLTLSASCYIKNMKQHTWTAEIDLKPALDQETLYKRITQDFALLANKSAQGALAKLLPASMQPVMVRRWGIDPATKANQITREEKRRLVELIKHWKVPITKRGDLEHAVITSGGVEVKGVNPKTMESKLCPGLYFAGEVLDLDAYTGGYNLQIAFSTAQAAARAF